MTGDVPGDLRTMRSLAEDLSRLARDVQQHCKDRKAEGKNDRPADWIDDADDAQLDAMRWLSDGHGSIADVALRVRQAQIRYPHLELKCVRSCLYCAGTILTSPIVHCRWVNWDELLDCMERCDNVAKRELKRMEDAYEETQNRSRGIKYAAIS